MALFGSKKSQAQADLQAAELVFKQRGLELEDAGKALAEASAEREAAAAGDDALLDRLDDAVYRRRILRDRAEARLDIARQSLERAREAAEHEAREEARAKATAAHEKAAKEYAATYANAARALLQLWRECAIADLACRQAGLALTADSEARRKEWLRPVEIERKRLTLWTDLRGTPLDPQPRDAEIRSGANGAMVLPKPDASADFPVQKLEFDRIVCKPDTGAWRAPPSIAQTIVLPGIGAGDFKIWDGERDYHPDPDILLPRVEKALALLQQQLDGIVKRMDGRTVEIRLEPVAAEDPKAEPSDFLETEDDEADETEDELA